MQSLDTKGSTVTFDFKANMVTTDMVSAVELTMGEQLTTAPSPENQGPPYLAKAVEQAGTSTNTHYHPGYYLRTFVKGSYRMEDVEFVAYDMLLAQPGALTGEEGPGPAGAEELIYFDSVWAASPFFPDDDDRSSTYLEQVAAQSDHFAYLRGVTPPPPDHDALNIKMDREKDKLEYPKFDAWPCQLGPNGFGHKPESDDASRYAILLHFKHEVSIQNVEAKGWSIAVVLSGDCMINGVTRDFDSACLTPPGAELNVQVGDGGAWVMFYCETGFDAQCFLEACSIS